MRVNIQDDIAWLLEQAQGAFKYGGYEYFKKFYSDIVGEKRAAQWKTSLYLTASASAELIADVALCPFEAVKVRMQTTIPPDIKSTFSGISGIVSKEGSSGYVLNSLTRCNPFSN